LCPEKISVKLTIAHLLKKLPAFFPPRKTKDKGKAIPLQAWTDLEGSSRLRLQDFKTIRT